MKRGPAWGERALIHVTLNTNDKQRFALVDENYSPQAAVAVARIPASRSRFSAMGEHANRRPGWSPMNRTARGRLTRSPSSFG